VGCCGFGQGRLEGQRAFAFCHTGFGASAGLGLIIGVRLILGTRSIVSILAGIAYLFSARVGFRRAGGRLVIIVTERTIIPAVRGRRRVLGALRAGMRIEEILSSVEDLVTVSAAREPTGTRKHGVLHAENRFAVGTAGG
jgi:hypothetical protein